MWDYFIVIYDTHLREIKRIVGDHLNIRIYQYIFLVSFTLFYIYFHHFTINWFLKKIKIHNKLGDIIEIWQTETQKDSNFDFFRIGVGKRKSKKDKI